MSEKDTYQIEYDAAMAKLEAESGDKPETNTSPVENVEAQAEASQQTPDEIQLLKEKLEKQEKALKDTQRWGHQNAAKLAKLEREREEAIKQQSRPTILDDNPGLEEAIKHIATPSTQKDLVQTLETALPELDGLLNEDEFKELFFPLRDSAIDTWKADPLSAVRDISALQSKYLTDKAVANAQKDFAEKKKKLSGMSVPGGSGGKGQSQEVDEVKQVWNMSKAEFDKQRAKVMGY